MLRTRKLIFLIALLIASTGLIQAQDSAGDVLFRETFDDNARDWETAYDDTVFSDVVDGHFRVEVKGGNWFVMPGFNDWSKAPVISGDYELDFTVSNIEASSDNFCIVAIIQGQQDYNDLVRAYWCQNNIWSFRQGDRYESGDYIAPDFQAGSHQIGAQAYPDRYVLFVDGEQIGTVSASGLPTGSVGLGIARFDTNRDLDASIEFDDLIVRSLAVEPAQPQSQTEPQTQAQTVAQAEAPQGDTVLFSESFSDNARAWDVANEDNVLVAVGDGTFHVELRNNGAVKLAGWDDWSKAPIISGSYEIEFTLIALEASTDNFCVTTLFNGQQEFDGTAMAFFCQNNVWSFRQGDRFEKGTYLAPDFRTGSYQIKVQVYPDRYLFFINGEQIGSVAATGPTQGSIGMGLVQYDTGASLTATADYDDLIVRSLVEAPDAPAPVAQEPQKMTLGDQEFTVLPYGAWIDSTDLSRDSICLGALKGAVYLFEGSSGDVVDIQMNWRPIVLGDVPPVNGQFAVVDPQSQEILAQSKLVFSIDPRIEYLDNFTLPHDGYFAIAIGVTEGDGCMTYELGIKQEVNLYANYKGRFEDAQFVIQEFDGVPMVQVPPGCFTLGSNDLQRALNGHEVCFDKPFWIDQYEVTVGEFDQLGGKAENTASYTNPLQPRDRISWYEARDFCELRGARLPTEVEWEYAGRGPENLNYPWGNQFVPVALVWKDEEANLTVEDQLTSFSDFFMGNTPRDEAQPVGSRPAGVSWVGAYDMSGNLSEWTSTLESDYPYDPADGREDQNVAGDRIIRGGYFTASLPATFLLANRDTGLSELTHLTYIGFRCARDDNS